MIRIRFTAADLARVRFAPRPAPLQELNIALLMATRQDPDWLFDDWRRRLLRSLPVAVRPLADLVPGGSAPLFLDQFDHTVAGGLDSVRGTSPAFVRSELERVYAGHPKPPPPWVRDLHRGDADAWRLFRHAHRTAFQTVLGPVWPMVEDLHRAEFTRHALTVAERGVGAALVRLVPGSRLHEDTWEFQPPEGLTGGGVLLVEQARDVTLAGRALVLLPTFHWTGQPLLADGEDGSVVLTYPAGDGLPLTPDGTGGSGAALAAVLGRTRLDALLLLASEHTTSGLARRLGVSNATASAHTAALRGAGLITTVRAGRSVLHHRTELGSLLVHRHTGPS